MIIKLTFAAIAASGIFAATSAIAQYAIPYGPYHESPRAARCYQPQVVAYQDYPDFSDDSCTTSAVNRIGPHWHLHRLPAQRFDR